MYISCTLVFAVHCGIDWVHSRASTVVSYTTKNSLFEGIGGNFGYSPSSVHGLWWAESGVLNKADMKNVPRTRIKSHWVRRYIEFNADEIKAVGDLQSLQYYANPLYVCTSNAACKLFLCLSFRHRSDNLRSSSWVDPNWAGPTLFILSVFMEEAFVHAPLFICQNTLAGCADHHLLCSGWESAEYQRPLLQVSSFFYHVC